MSGAGFEREIVDALRSGALDRVIVPMALVAARVAPLAVLAPFIALRGAPPAIRAAVVLVLTAAFVPVASAHVAPDVAASWLPIAMLREAAIGLAFAFATAVPFHALDFGGRLTDTFRGASLAEVIAPPTGERTSPLGDLYLLFGVALFASLGGHRLAIEVFARSFETLPIGAAVDFGRASFALGVGKLFAFSMAFGLAVAAPAALTIVLVDAALGLLGRASPSVPVFFAGMPLRAAAGIVGALLGLAVVGDRLPDVFRDAFEAAGRLLAGLS